MEKWVLLYDKKLFQGLIIIMETVNASYILNSNTAIWKIRILQQKTMSFQLTRILTLIKVRAKNISIEGLFYGKNWDHISKCTPKLC